MRLPFLRTSAARISIVERAGVRIRFLVQGRGMRTVFLHHGIGGSIEAWVSAGYVDALAREYRVVAIDARGHGESDKPHDPAAYGVDTRIGDVLAVLDAAEVSVCDYWGYSMGGWVGFQLLARHPERVRRFVAGASAVRRAPSYEQAVRSRAEALLSGDVARIARDLEITLDLAERMASEGDVQALGAMQLASLEWPGTDVSGIETPCLLYAGEHDPMVEDVRQAAKRMRHASFALVAESDHLEAFLRSNLVLPVVQAFLAADA